MGTTPTEKLTYRWPLKWLEMDVHVEIAEKRGLEGRLWFSQGLVYDEAYDILQDSLAHLNVSPPP